MNKLRLLTATELLSGLRKLQASFCNRGLNLVVQDFKNASEEVFRLRKLMIDNLFGKTISFEKFKLIKKL
jgi:hypothetical protein